MDKKNVPKLRFTEFKDEWESKKFSEIFEIVGNNTLSRNELNYTKGDIKNIHYGDILIKYGYCVDCLKNEVPYININVDVSKNKNNNYLKRGDVIIADTAEDEIVGKAIEITNVDKAVAGLHTIPCRPKLMFAKGFLGYLINSPSYHNRIRHLFTGIKVLSINKSEIKKTNLIITGINEQQKIADLLTTVDERIELIENKIEHLESAKKGAMQKIFSQEIRFKDDEGNEFPKWEEKKLNEVGTITSNGVDKISKNNEKQVNLLNYMDVYNSIRINSNNSNKLMQTTANDSQIIKNNIKKGDVFITPSSETAEDIGHSLEIIEDLPNTVYSYHIVRFRPNINIFKPGFLNHALNSNIIRKQFIFDAQGVQRYTISKPNFEKTIISYSCKMEQQKIADFLSTFDEQIELRKEEFEHWKNIKKGLLQQMFV